MVTITAHFVRFLGKSHTFAVARYENGPNLDEVKVSLSDGTFNPLIEEGEWFTAEGRWRDSMNKRSNQKEQIFNARSIHPALPITRKGVSQLFLRTFTLQDHGIDGRSIQAYVEKHGPAGATKAEKEPELLLEMTKDRKVYGERILRDWAKRISNREAIRLLEAARIDQQKILEILGVHKNATMAVIRRNPYEFVTIPGITFDDVDKLGRHMGVKFDDPRRVRAVLSHLAARADGEGHTYVPYAELKEDFKRLEITGESLKPVLADTSAGDIVVRPGKGGEVILQKKSLLDAERRIAKRLAEILARRDTIDRAFIDGVTDEVLSQDKYRHIRSDPSQMEAVRRSVREPVAVLTGGPGTGKSTVTEAIAEIAQRIASGPIKLAAPAGKAARRQEEATKYKYKASTVHKLLEAKGKGGATFNRNRGNPLDPGCFVVIDESSMLDVEVAAALLDALPPNGRILFVGDEAQLRSVGAGNFFGDMMRAVASNGNRIPVSRLEKVHRNSAQSKIAHYAREIREGSFSSAKLDNIMRGGVAFYDYPNNRITDKIVALVSSGARKHLGLDPKKDVAVLCPKKNGNAGTWQLNTALSQAINPHGAAIRGFVRSGADRDEPVPRVGDRVMLTENDGENDVSNGDVGTIVSAGPDEHNNNRPAVWVEFDTGETVAFNMSEAQKLILAYAITGHKSQGSQYPLVVMPMTMDHRNMLDKNLVYTEWTRAKEHLILVGDKEALDYGVTNVTTSQRRTRLQEFLEEELAKIPALTPDMPRRADQPRAAPKNPFTSTRAARTIMPAAPAVADDYDDLDDVEAGPPAVQALQAVPRRSFARRMPPARIDPDDAPRGPAPR
jgi:ATP-dependent exoDNAse (exonuclease V), alpha subunit - helicase superfamily I member